MSDTPLFQNTDEQERVFAPESLPGTNLPLHEVDAGGTVGTDTSRDLEPPAAAPVANVGTSQATQAASAPPNIGDNDQRTAPGDPETQARYPIGDNDRRT